MKTQIICQQPRPDAIFQRTELRCRKCGRLLAIGEVIRIEVKCPKCKQIQVLVAN